MISYLHDSVQVLSGRGHGAGVNRWAHGHHGDVMVLGQCGSRDDDRGVVGWGGGRQHLQDESGRDVPANRCLLRFRNLARVCLRVSNLWTVCLSVGGVDLLQP